MASSRVGSRMRAPICTRSCLPCTFCVRSAFCRRSMMGSMKLRVLPVPVCAVARTSRPSRAGGIANACTGVGTTKFNAARRFCSSGVRGNSLNNFNLGFLCIAGYTSSVAAMCDMRCSPGIRSCVIPVGTVGAARYSFLYVGEKRWDFWMLPTGYFFCQPPLLPHDPCVLEVMTLSRLRFPDSIHSTRGR
jgi:hypothetical protein